VIDIKITIGKENIDRPPRWKSTSKKKILIELFYEKIFGGIGSRLV
jgi:hypothetical protein